MKKGTFKKVSFSIEPGMKYGYYVIRANYYKKSVTVGTSDSELYDWIDDDSDREKNLNARRGCYYLIRCAAL